MEDFMKFGKFRIPDGSQAGMLDAMGPSLPSQFIGQAAAFVWLLLPAERRTPKEVAKALHLMVDREVLALAEDADFFGKSPPPPSGQPDQARLPPEKDGHGMDTNE